MNNEPPKIQIDENAIMERLEKSTPAFNEILNKEWIKLIKQAMGKTIKERSKTMTVADLKSMLKNMPDDAEITADENVIKKVTADIDLNGNIERVDFVLK